MWYNCCSQKGFSGRNGSSAICGGLKGDIVSVQSMLVWSCHSLLLNGTDITEQISYSLRKYRDVESDVNAEEKGTWWGASDAVAVDEWQFKCVIESDTTLMMQPVNGFNDGHGMRCTKMIPFFSNAVDTPGRYHPPYATQTGTEDRCWQHLSLPLSPETVSVRSAAKDLPFHRSKSMERRPFTVSPPASSLTRRKRRHLTHRHHMPPTKALTEPGHMGAFAQFLK